MLGDLYNGENRLTKRTDPDGTETTKTYEADGLRRGKQAHGAAPTTFVWDGCDYLAEY